MPIGTEKGEKGPNYSAPYGRHGVRNISSSVAWNHAAVGTQMGIVSTDYLFHFFWPAYLDFSRRRVDFFQVAVFRETVSIERRAVS